MGGTVVDASDAIVGGATVAVVNNATNAEQTARADSAGYFRVIHLQPGTDPYGTGRTIVRGGYGMFFARAINSTLYQALIGTGAAGSQRLRISDPREIQDHVLGP